MDNLIDQQVDPAASSETQFAELKLAVTSTIKAIPTDRFDGLRDVLLLVQEVVASEQSPELSEDAQQVELLQELLLCCEKHLNNPINQDHIDDMLAIVFEFCEASALSQDDQLMLREMLVNDLATVVSSGYQQAEDNVNDELEDYKACVEQFIESASQQKLSGVQDVLLLLQEWLLETAEAGDKQATINQIFEVVDGYLAASSDPAVLVDQMLSGLASLGGSCQLDATDVAALTEVLIEERMSVGQEPQLNPEVNVDQSEPEEPPVNSEDAIVSNGSEIVLPQDVQALQELLVMAHEQLDQSINNALIYLSDQAADDSSRKQAVETLQEDLQRFVVTVTAADWAGLNSSCDHVQQNVNTLVSAAKPWTEEQCVVLSQWSETINSYLQAPLDTDAKQGLLLCHLSSEWPESMGEEQAANLLSGMQNLLTKETDDPANFRQQEATDEDVSLALPEDVVPELLDSLLQELPGHTSEFSDTIGELVQGGTLDDVTKAQRIAHTVKGAGNTVGIVGIANLTHHLEDILTALAYAKKLPNNNIANTLMRSSDCLAEMSDALANGGSAPSDAKEVLQEVLDLAHQIDQQGIPEHEQEPAKPSISSHNSNADISSANQPVPSETVEEQMIRLPVSVIDNLLQLANEVMLVNGQLRQRFRDTTEQAKNMQSHLDQLLGLGLELEDLINVRNIDLFSKQGEADIGEDFDALEMDQYNELHTCSRRLYEVATDTRELGKAYANSLRKMDDFAIEQGILNDNSREQLLAMRLVSSKSIVPRLQRCVRQASRLTGKQIELSIEGQDLQIDRDLLNGMLDPLMHLLRNAVDHGIENEEQRVAAGKSAIGSIALSFKYDKNFISIECRDDGAGLNLEAIRSKAIDRGLISASTELTEDELKQLIFQPNFSTRSEVTQVSGRGVGMDAVMNAVRGLGGSLHIDTLKDLGSVFHIQLPQSLVHYHAVIVRIGTQAVAIAERGVSQILHPGSGMIKGSDDDLTFEFGDEVYPVKKIESLLTRVRPGRNLSLQQRTVILIEQRESKYAVLVESIAGVKEVVVKGFDAFVPKIHGIIGASILDDGSIAPVIDIQELLEEPNRWADRDVAQELLEQSAQDLPCALVVDDSLSARRSLEHFMADMGFEVMAARDGLEATEKVTERVPDIIITDLEMPRLNGIELTEFVRSRVASQEVPVIMVTSRSTAKHRELAEAKGVNAYLNKPFAEDTLAEAVMNLFRPKNEQRDVA